MENLNPFFHTTHHKNGIAKKSERPVSTRLKRRIRSDKCHNIKFPVDPILKMKLKTYCKLHQERFGQEWTQTKFNTALLRFGLKHLEQVNWSIPYKDTRIYFHTMLRESEYKKIGGAYGIAIRNRISERRSVYCILVSMLQLIEKGDFTIEQTLQ